MDLAKILLDEVVSGIDSVLLERPGLLIVPVLKGYMFIVVVIYGYEEWIRHSHTVDLNEPDSMCQMTSWLAATITDPDQE